MRRRWILSTTLSMGKTMRTLHRAAFLLFASAALLGAGAVSSAQSRAVPQAPPTPPAGSPGSTVELDRDGDGVIDYRVIYDRSGLPAEEDMDYNNDGKMDTFYYYTRGVLQRVEIDSNNDGKVDIWVTILDGKYIQRYEQDTDGDGKPDRVRDFGKD
jgi:hypothetical protein